MGVSPPESVPFDPSQKPMCLSECQLMSSDVAHDDDTLPSPLQVQGPSKHPQSEDASFEEQAVLSKIEYDEGRGPDCENCDVVVETEHELEKPAPNVTSVEVNPGQPLTTR